MWLTRIRRSRFGEEDDDGDLADDDTDPLTLTSTAYFNGVKHTVEAVVKQINTDPLSHWTLDETTGGVANDVASGHDGTYENGVTLPAGPTDPQASSSIRAL